MPLSFKKVMAIQRPTLTPKTKGDNHFIHIVIAPQNVCYIQQIWMCTSLKFSTGHLKSKGYG